MRIATKIFAGYAALISIMTALVAYQAISFGRMQSIVTRLSSADFQAGRFSLQLMRDRDLVEEYARKSFALRDLDYAKKIDVFLRSFDGTLGGLRSSARSQRVREEQDELARLWKEFLRDIRAYLAESPQLWPAALPAELETRLEDMRVRIEGIYSDTLAEIDSDVKSSDLLSRQTQLISWGAAALTLLLCLVVSFFIVRSITRPLRQLAAGTRAVAEGRFHYHLDTSRQDELAQLGRDFSAMTRRLSELDTLKKDFVFHVSHELKSPLASMQENIRLLLDQIPGPLTDKQQRLLGLNLRSARRLSAMISNLLDISRMEAGAMQYEIKTHNLAELVRTAVAEAQPMAREKQLRLLMLQPGPISLRCDHDRILQVVENLLGNAIKFSPATGTIEVSVQRTNGLPAGGPDAWRAKLAPHADKEDYVTIAVADNGPGIPDSQKEKIFEKFHQMSKTKEMAGQGVGLGLAIARTIVEAHNGGIWVEDNPGGGSRFVVTIPLEESDRLTPLVSPPI